MNPRPPQPLQPYHVEGQIFRPTEARPTTYGLGLRRSVIFLLDPHLYHLAPSWGTIASCTVRVSWI